MKVNKLAKPTPAPWRFISRHEAARQVAPGAGEVAVNRAWRRRKRVRTRRPTKPVLAVAA